MAAAALGPAGEAMAAPGPGAGAASGGASGGGGAGGGGSGSGASAGSGSSGVGGRLPSRVLELVFSYLELSELRSCALVCKHWYRCLHGDENSEVWRSLCARSLAEEALRTDILCNLPSYKAKVRESRGHVEARLLSRPLLSGFTVKAGVRGFTSASRLSTASASQYHSHPSSPKRSFLWIEVLLRNPPHFLKILGGFSSFIFSSRSTFDSLCS